MFSLMNQYLWIKVSEVSSTIDMDHSLTNKERVIASCKALSKKITLIQLMGRNFTIKMNSMAME